MLGLMNRPWLPRSRCCSVRRWRSLRGLCAPMLHDTVRILLYRSSTQHVRALLIFFAQRLERDVPLGAFPFRHHRVELRLAIHGNKRCLVVRETARRQLVRLSHISDTDGEVVDFSFTAAAQNQDGGLYGCNPVSKLQDTVQVVLRQKTYR